MKKWTKKYHERNPDKKSFGGKVIITMKNGSTISDEIEVADAHPNGRRPFGRQEYINKFRTLTANLITEKECQRFLNSVQNLKKLRSGDLKKLNIEMIPQKRLKKQKNINFLTFFKLIYFYKCGKKTTKKPLF